MKRWYSRNYSVFSILLVSMLLVLALVSACAAPAPAPTSPKAPASVPIPTPTPTPPPASGAVPSTRPTTPSPASKATKPTSPSSAPRMHEYSQDSGTVGLSTGGAKDINNFRENIRNNYLPIPTDITYEGLFYDYYFDTGETKPCNKLFCPSYSIASTRDPFSRKTEYYLSVGLNSGMKERDFERKKLNLVVVLDISGSMSSPFDEYYYDQAGRQVRLDSRELNTQKIEVAKDALLSIMSHLNNDDRFGIVLYNSRSSLLQPLNLVRQSDMDEIEDNILAIRANGSTALSEGMQLATELLNKYRNADPFDYENRIIFLTDAMPNTGEFGSNSLLNLLKKNADNHIYTTFIGIGVDFNTALVEDITKTRGANYYSVHSPGDFMERMDDEFDYMVTPLVFNLRLNLDAKGWDIEQVYGSPEADRATGDLMKVNTLFPSKKEDGETKGGLILLKLKKKGGDTDNLRLKVSYEDRAGNKSSSEATVYFEDTKPEYFENSGIQKGILLARYADLMKDWIIDEREHAHWSRPWEPCINEEDGIVIPPTNLGTWERQSLPLTVSTEYRRLFKEFSKYFASETEDIGDVTLEQELDILESLSRAY
jgi:Ca-activated chloride channel family protein